MKEIQSICLEDPLFDLNRTYFENGMTALHYSILYRQYTLATTLLSLGAWSNALDDYGMNCLHFFIRHYKYVEDLPFLHLLVRYGADINSVDQHGYTILHHAIAQKRSWAVKGILKHAPNLLIHNLEGARPIDMVIGLSTYKDEENRKIHKRVFRSWISLLRQYEQETYPAFESSLGKGACPSWFVSQCPSFLKKMFQTYQGEHPLPRLILFFFYLTSPDPFELYTLLRSGGEISSYNVQSCIQHLLSISSHISLPLPNYKPFDLTSYIQTVYPQCSIGDEGEYEHLLSLFLYLQHRKDDSLFEFADQATPSLDYRPIDHVFLHNIHRVPWHTPRDQIARLHDRTRKTSFFPKMFSKLVVLFSVYLYEYRTGHRSTRWDIYSADDVRGLLYDPMFLIRLYSYFAHLYK